MLRRLTADGFRNLHDVDIAPHARLTVLVGDNGQGKTNVLEAAHLVTALRPLRAVEKAHELVGFGRERGAVRGVFDIDGPLNVDVAVEPRGRRALVGGKAVRDVAALAGRLAVVSFVPEDSAIIRGGPGERRRALDRFCFSLFPAFAQVSRRFEDALEQRNRVLKDVVVNHDELDAFTEPFIEAAAALVRLRALGAERWAPAFSVEQHNIALMTSGEVGLSYACGATGDDVDDDDVDPRHDEAVATRLRARLQRGRAIELKKRSTLCGPQHDDLIITQGAHKARFLASQGEARTLVLALKLAAVRVLKTELQRPPLVLLDDVAGELDALRAQRLLAALAAHEAQCFVTTTSLQTLPALPDAQVLTVRAGRVHDVTG